MKKDPFKEKDAVCKCLMCKKAEVQVGTIRIACYVGNLLKPMHIRHVATIPFCIKL